MIDGCCMMIYVDLWWLLMIYDDDFEDSTFGLQDNSPAWRCSKDSSAEGVDTCIFVIVIIVIVIIVIIIVMIIIVVIVSKYSSAEGVGTLL